MITLIMLICCRVYVTVSTLLMPVSCLIMSKCLIINLPPVLTIFGPVESQIIEEISEGRYIVTDGPPRLVSAIGAIPKSSKGVRLIHDCSRPRGCAVNDFAPLGAKVRFQSLDDAVELLQPGGYSAKVDLKSAYRSVKIHASNFPFTGLSWVFPVMMTQLSCMTLACHSEARCHLRFSIV